MKRFKWRLERVLKIKQKEEQAKRAQLVDITQRLSQARGELFIQKRILQDLIDELSEMTLQERLIRQEFLMKYSKANRVKIKALEADVETLAAQQQQKIADVMKIRQFNEGLEKLRVEARNEFSKEQEMMAQKEQDEITTVRFARKAMVQ